MATQRRKPLGTPLRPIGGDGVRIPDKQRLAELSALWDANCPPQYRGLMDAAPVSDKVSQSRFVYDNTRLCYIVRKTGRKIPQVEINRAFAVFQRKRKLGR